MGLFGGNKCVICGKESGFFGGLVGTSLAGDGFLCSDCRDKCGPGSALDFGKMTESDVRARMETAEANKKKGAQEFRATRSFNTGRYRDTAFLSVDEDHRWFMKANDCWVYSLDDVFTFTVAVEYVKLENGQSYYLDTYEFPELPKCPDGMKINVLKMNIWLAENDLGADRVELDLLPSFFPDEGDVRGGYACAHEFFEFMRSYCAARKQGRT
jgi:hypothetical protein